MRKAKTGREIVNDLHRHIAQALQDLNNLDNEAENWRCQSARHALTAMYNSTKVVNSLIGNLTAPQRPRRKSQRTPENKLR
jgi:hypothetical protein